MAARPGDGPLAGRGAVVTGGGRGIGAAIAAALGAAGATVVIAARTTAEIDRVALAVRERGGRAHAVECDVADEASVRRLGEAAQRHVGTVEILVNNAGGAGSAPLSRLSLAEWNEVMAVNATGTFLCTREFAPAMVARGRGRVINIASVAGLEGARYVSHYAAAKHAVVGFTRSVALELAGTGVTVNVVCPAYVDTPMTERTLARVQDKAGLSREQALEAVLSSTGQQRLVTPEEVANVVLGLCADDAGGRNGEIVVLGVESMT